ncbi:hypothetical protein [Streptomyces sp. NPDC090080]|uniref:hypothetical protein n=1 Tax=Streptomyces sp. NPDC090080 TaxID=3365939 RepID=UPI00381B9C54
MTSDIGLWAGGTAGTVLMGAIAYEWVMDVKGRTTLRLPFLALRLALVSTRFRSRHLRDECSAELHYILRDDDAPWITRLANGLRYATPLAVGGACCAVRDVGKHLARTRAVRLRVPAANRGISSGIFVGGVFVLAVELSPLSQAAKAVAFFTPPSITICGFLVASAFRTLVVKAAPPGRRRRQWRSP